ncbi:MAG: hypothetical protein V1649_04555 [Patescibacteria group bacterium]
MNKIITALNIILAVCFFVLANLFFWLSFLLLPKLIETSYQITINLIFAIFLMGGSIIFFRKTKEKYLYGIVVLSIIWAETSFFLAQKFGKIDLLTILFLGIPFGIPLLVVFLAKYFDKLWSNKILFKILILILLAIFIAGGFFAWQYFKVSEIKSLEIIPSQKTEQGVVYQEGAKAIITGKNLNKVELYQRGGGTGIYTSPEGGLIGTALKTKTSWGKEIWEVISLPAERLIVELCAVGFDEKENKVGEVCLFNVYSEIAQNINKTAYWNTFKSGLWDFEIKYPSFLSVAEFPGADALGQTLIKFSNRGYLDYPDILIKLRPTSLTPTESVHSDLCKPLPSGDTLCTTPKPGLISGSIQIKSQGTHFNSIDTVFQSPENNTLFDISINEKFAAPIPQDELEVYNQMLFTFKFLNESDVNNSKINLSSTPVNFSQEIKGTLSLNLINAVVGVVGEGDIYAGAPVAGAKTYTGDAVLSFEGSNSQKSELALGKIVFVENTFHDGNILIKKLNPVNDQDFIVIPQYGTSNFEMVKFYGYDLVQKKLIQYNFKWGVGSITNEIYFFPREADFKILPSKEFVVKVYDNSIGKYRVYQWKFNGRENIFELLDSKIE